MQLSKVICQKIYDNIVMRNIQVGSPLETRIEPSHRFVVIGMNYSGDTLYVKDKRTKSLKSISLDNLSNYRVVRSKILSEEELVKKSYITYYSHDKRIFLNHVSYAKFIVNLKVGSLIVFKDAIKPQIVLSTNPILVFLCDTDFIPKETEIGMFIEKNHRLILNNLIIKKEDEYYGITAKIVTHYDTKQMERGLLKLKLMYGDLYKYAFNYKK